MSKRPTVTQMTEPEYKVEFDGEEMYVMCNGVKLAMRRDDVGCQSKPVLQFVTSSKTGSVELR